MELITGGTTLTLVDFLSVPSWATISPDVFVATTPAWIAKTPLLAPAGIKTSFGACMAGLLEDNTTDNPPLGATPVNKTVPCCAAPPVIDDCCSFTDANAAGFTVSVLDLASAPAVAVIITFTFCWTDVEPMTNDALVAPAGT
jgi:hypothetical protein